MVSSERKSPVHSHLDDGSHSNRLSCTGAEGIPLSFTFPRVVTPAVPPAPLVPGFQAISGFFQSHTYLHPLGIGEVGRIQKIQYWR